MIPRPEYPRPQMVRDKWINLNGEWEFEIDNAKSGRDRKLFEGGKLKDRIIVPFCPESTLSGIGNTDFMYSVWYRRKIHIPENWYTGKTLLHFGAVDHHAQVWINGISAGSHKGGYAPFDIDITGYLVKGENVLVVAADDDTRSAMQPSGKQSDRYESYRCMYTRTTGIWQTVWLEHVPDTYISGIRLSTDIRNSRLRAEVNIKGNERACKIYADSYYSSAQTGHIMIDAATGYNSFEMELSELYLWEAGNGRLYDLEIKLADKDGCFDSVKSYFGMRSIEIQNDICLLNGKPVFQRLVLDQGYYPDGIYTAPDELCLKKDIEIALGSGFNGARLHQKVFEPGYLYWADRLGFLVWGEHASWGLDVSKPEAIEAFLPEWMEVLDRDCSHPSIIGWCPFNETQADQDDEVIRIVYKITKKLDPTRPVIDTSGWTHVESDMMCMHDYDQDPKSFAARYQAGNTNFVSEYGGIWWNTDPDTGWGYGKRPADICEFYERYEGLTDALLKNPDICAFCYTQLYDVEQECNGLYTYDRKPKFDAGRIKEINTRRASVECR